MNIWWYFVPFLLVPILVHLFDFRKAKKLYFSSVKYIAELASKTQSKSKIKYLLILTNRILIFLAVITLIWMLINGQKNVSEAGIVGAHFDNSVSSTVDNTSVVVEEGLNALSDQYGAIVYFDNVSKSVIEKESVFRVESDPTIQSAKWNVLLNRFNDNDLSSIFLFSDYQNADISNLKSLLSDSTMSFHLLQTSDLNRQRNVSVDTLFVLPNQDNLSEVSIFVKFRVFNMESGSVVVKLMNGARQLSSVVKDIGELDQVRFDISKSMFGKFEIVIDGDDVSLDNRFHFSIEERIKPKITIVKSSKSAIISAVFSNSELFDVVEQDINRLDYQLLQESDLVVLSNRYSIPEVMLNLKEIDFIVFPADSIDISSYEQLVGVSIDKLEEGSTETTIDSNNPLLKGIFDKNAIEQSMSVNAAPFGFEGSFEPIIQFRGGNSFLLKNNNVYFFNTFINRTAGFQSNALFLPILFQIAFNSSDALGIPYYYPGQLITVAADASDVPIKLVREQFEIIPTFNSNGSQIILELPSELVNGNYHLIQGIDTLRSIAVNIPKSESIMKAPSLEELQDAFEEFEHVTVSKIIGGNEDMLFAGGSQSSLWKYALILAVFLLLTETVLHRYLK